MTEIQEEQAVKAGIWSKIKNWWLTLTKEQWQLTVYFPGETKILPDGTRIDSGAPQVYDVAKIIKMSHTHMIFIDTNKTRTEIKLTDPVGYTIRKIY